MMFLSGWIHHTVYPFWGGGNSHLEKFFRQAGEGFLSKVVDFFWRMCYTTGGTPRKGQNP
jgi:hypothetical protein